MAYPIVAAGMPINGLAIMRRCTPAVRGAQRAVGLIE